MQRKKEKEKEHGLEQKQSDAKEIGDNKSEKLPRNKSEKRACIWQQRDIDRLFSEIQSPSVKIFVDQSRTDLFKPLHSKSPKEVYLFDIAESKHRSFALGKRFGMYIQQSYFADKLRCTTLKYKSSESFCDIISLYEQFSVVNADEERKGPRHGHFSNELLQTLFFTIPENYALEDDKISFETRWLKIMSWWKFFNQSLVPSCQELHACLATNADNQERNRILQLRSSLNESLRKLNLIGLPTEIVVLKMYIEFSNILFDVEAWNVNQESATKRFQEDCFQNVSFDSLWRHFLKECSDYSLSLFCNAMQFISENGFDANNVGKIMVNDIEDFVSQLMKQHATEKSEEDYTSRLTETTLKKFDKFVTEINVRKKDGGCNLTTVICLCYQMISSLMKVTVRTFEHLLGDSHTVTSQKALSKYLLNIVINGSIVADKVLQNGSLLSRNFLRQLKEEEMHVYTSDLTTERLLKFAYILSISYEIINGHNTTMIVLPNNYTQHDFVSFLNDINGELSTIPQIELSMIEFSLEMRQFQDELLQELGKTLSNINKTANNAKILLNK